jgi:hypothetical protein
MVIKPEEQDCNHQTKVSINTLVQWSPRVRAVPCCNQSQNLDLANAQLIICGRVRPIRRLPLEVSSFALPYRMNHFEELSIMPFQ